MKCFAVIFALFAAASAQLAAWPATSYSPFYQALYSGAAAPAYAASPVVAAAAPVVAAAAPAVVPAYSPFQTAAYFYGSNKGKSGVKA